MAANTVSDQKSYRFIVQQNAARDPRSAAYLKDALALGLDSIRQISSFDLFFIQGNCSVAQFESMG